MYIGLISDTHGIFDDNFRKFLEPVDEIWHAGDFGGGFTTAAQIAEFKPLKGVIGNCDDRDLIYDYPVHRHFECEGMGVLMMHIGGYPGHYERQAKNLIETYRPDIFVCGHSHILRVMNDPHYRMMVMNPGAAGLQGFHLVRTALRFKIENREISDLEVYEIEKK